MTQRRPRPSASALFQASGEHQSEFRVSGECTVKPRASRPLGHGRGGSNQQDESGVNSRATYICPLMLRLDRGHEGTTTTARLARAT